MVISTKLAHVKRILHKVNTDQRGHLTETINSCIFRELNDPTPTFVQENIVYSKKDVLRGLHYQKPPMTQGKLVYVAYGTILSAIVDVRKECCGVNETFLIKDISEAGMKDLLWIPSGYAHGFLVMSAEAVVVYKLTNFYSPEHEEILLWNDPKLAIDWKLDDRIPIMKKQDRDGKLLSEITLL